MRTGLRSGVSELQLPCFTAVRAEIALMSGSAFAVTHHAFSSGAGRTSDGNGSHWSTSKTPSYTKSVSWQHHQDAETSSMGKIIYHTMFDNMQKAIDLNRPACQDTGEIMFFVKVGSRFPLLGELQSILKQAVEEATVKAPLRHNAVEIFDEVNTGKNTGSGVPWVTWDIIPDNDDAEIEVYMAGGGCTLPGRSKVLMPSEGYEGVVKFVFENISTLAVNACPPVLVGVGIATSVETAAVLSRKAILRPIGSRHPNPKAAELELRLEEGLNRLGIGPQGLTGNSSVMGVHIESAARHPSTIGVAVSTGCWAHRRGTLLVHADLTFENLSHTRSAL